MSARAIIDDRVLRIRVHVDDPQGLCFGCSVVSYNTLCSNINVMGMDRKKHLSELCSRIHFRYLLLFAFFFFFLNLSCTLQRDFLIR